VHRVPQRRSLGIALDTGARGHVITVCVITTCSMKTLENTTVLTSDQQALPRQHGDGGACQARSFCVGCDHVHVSEPHLVPGAVPDLGALPRLTFRSGQA